MFGTYDWFSVSNTKKVQLDAVDHLVGGFLEEGHNQIINPITMLLDRLVLGLLNLLYEIKIAFHAFQLECIVLSIGIHAGNATRHNTVLDHGTNMRFLKRARPTDTKHLHKSGTNPGLNFPHVPAAGVDHMEQLLVIAAAAWFYLHLHPHKLKNNIKVSNI
jgi:hypothetical protein